MEIFRKHPFTGAERSIKIAVTEKQLDDWSKGMLIQDAMPNLTSDEREFIISGLLPKEFDEIFKDDDQDDEL